VFNPRISGIFAGVGFVLSFLMGLATGAHFPLLLIRAFIFAAVFFALASAGYGAIQMYLPELLAPPPNEAPALGGGVDISVGGDDDDARDFSLETGGFGDGLNDFLENPGNSGGDTLDQIGEAVYTGEGTVEDFQETTQPALPYDPGFSAGHADTVDMLPDLDVISGPFSSGPISVGGGVDVVGTDSPASSFDGPRAAGGQAPKAGLDEEFNVNEMASAIRTILKRENKG
jgi:hypothetical protein